MKQINQNVLKIKDPSTGQFTTIPNLTLDNNVDKVSGVEVRPTEPKDPLTDVWIDTTQHTTYKIPQIADDDLSEEDTWSSFKIKSKLDEVFELIYPVGSIYMSVNSISPDNLFGGTWEQIQGRFLLGASSTYGAGTTGGAATHTLAVNEIPSHNHPTYNGTGWAFMEINRDGTGARTQLATSSSSGKYAFTTTTTGDLQWAYNQTGKQGDGVAHNNMPPYLSVYIWKRTA